MDNLKLHLSVEQINTILFSLGRMPYENVFALIQEIKKQAEEQLPQQPKEE